MRRNQRKVGLRTVRNSPLETSPEVTIPLDRTSGEQDMSLQQSPSGSDADSVQEHVPLDVTANFELMAYVAPTYDAEFERYQYLLAPRLLPLPYDHALHGLVGEDPSREPRFLRYDVVGRIPSFSRYSADRRRLVAEAIKEVEEFNQNLVDGVLYPDREAHLYRLLDRVNVVDNVYILANSILHAGDLLARYLTSEELSPESAPLTTGWNLSLLGQAFRSNQSIPSDSIVSGGTEHECIPASRETTDREATSDNSTPPFIPPVVPQIRGTGKADRQVLATEPQRLKSLTATSLQEFHDDWMRIGTKGFKLLDYISSTVKGEIRMILSNLTYLPLDERLKDSHPHLLEEIRESKGFCWQLWGVEKLFEVLRVVLSPIVQETRVAGLLKEVRDIRFQTDFYSHYETRSFVAAVVGVLKKHGYINDEQGTDAPGAISARVRKELFKHIAESVRQGSPACLQDTVYSSVAELFLERTVPEDREPLLFMEGIETLCGLIHTKREVALGVLTLQRGPRQQPQGPRQPEEPRKRLREPVRSSEPPLKKKAERSALCHGCGRRHDGTCLLASHPDFNKSGVEWAASEIGRWYKTKKFDTLPRDKKRNGTEVAPWEGSVRLPTPQDKKQSEYTCVLHSAHSTLANPNVKFANLLTPHDSIQVMVLMDTGADTANYVNEDTARWLRSHGVDSSKTRKLVCSCFGECKESVEIVKNVNIRFYDLVNLIPFEFVLNFTVIPSLIHAVVIGSKSLHNNPKLEKIRKNPNIGWEPSVALSVPSVGNAGSPRVHQSISAGMPRSDLNPSGRPPKPVAPISGAVHVSELLDFEPEAWGIPEKEDALDDTLNREQLSSMHSTNAESDPDEGLPKYVEGDENLKAGLYELFQEYRDIFRRTVGPAAALIPPMELQIDESKWNSLRGVTGPARSQGFIKNEEIRRQVSLLIDLNCIQESQANRYSQVHLVPKPDKKWRFCLDYVALNTCCTMEGWRVPDIKQMIQRLGSFRPKYFAVMDLTSGYHQAPLSISSRRFTAFITYMGVYEWLRVPMGLKGAPAYFQHVIASHVLHGLMYTITELYIDDVIVHSQTPQELIDNLRIVFERFRRHRLYLNPDKCKFGLRTVEYVGHVIDERGHTFSTEKLEEVLNINPPTCVKEMRSFLGLASYFRDHLQHYADMVRPLHNILIGYDKAKRLVWTPEATQAFLNTREAIRLCPTLFFLEEDTARYPVIVYTDASDKGIGAAVVQLVDEIERPIAFMSKALSKQEQGWSTIEKECYSIVYALRKFNYLLQGITFTVRTDHENLKYLNDPPSPKVRRWKLALQEHDFYIEHIAGETNVVADGFSRLLSDNGENLYSISDLNIPRDKYKILGKMHNTQVGHHGVDRLIDKLTEAGHNWPYMRAHAQKFVRECPCCQKLRESQPPVYTHPFQLSTTRPMEELHIDTLSLGIKDEYQNEHILVVIDACSRWVEMYPIPDLSAITAAHKLTEHFGRYGQPFIIRSDNGTQFCNDIIDELLKCADVIHVRTTPYSHEENGIVERANKEILRHLRAVMFDKNIHSEWNRALPFVQRILNAELNTTTGVRPYQILFGLSVDLRRHIVDETVQLTDTTKTLSQWTLESLSLQQRVQKVLHERLSQKQSEHLAESDARRTDFPVGTLVLCSYPNDGIGTSQRSHKLKTPWKGPLRVVRKDKDMYTLFNTTTRREETVHVTRLKPFHHDPLQTNPEEIALRDHGQYIVESIEQHKGSPHKKSEMKFLVHWKGYDDIANTWEPWSGLRDNKVLHEYLASKGLRNLIPTKHRNSELA